MSIIDFSNSFCQTSGMSINNKGGNGMSKMAVAKQQSETLKNAFGNVSDTIDILEELLGTKAMSKQYESAFKTYENTQGGVSWSQFEWKIFDTQMKVFVENTIKIEDIQFAKESYRWKEYLKADKDLG